MFQVFQMYVANVLYQYCNGYTHMFQVYVPNVSSVSEYVASVSFGCYKTRSGFCIVLGVFICMLQVFHLDVCICLQWRHTCFQVFSGVLQMFQTYVANVLDILDVCCKCFI
jgi:hypothetical protein